MESKSGHIDIQNFLPHRQPMLMVDTVIDICKEKVTTSFIISEKNIFVHDNKLQEAGIIENMAQTCSSIFGQSFFENGNTKTKLIGFITNIKKVQIFSLPEVHSEITTKATAINHFDNICNVSCETFCDDVLLAQADINLFIQEVLP